MNPDRNVQFTVASVDELRSTSPIRRLFVVPIWKEGDDSIDCSKIAAIKRKRSNSN